MANQPLPVSPPQEPHATDSQRHTLVLRAWEAINSERELRGVLAAVADILVPIVPFNAIGIVSFEGEKHDLFAMHVVGMPLAEGESAEGLAVRAQEKMKEISPVTLFPDHTLVRNDHSSQSGESLQPYRPYHCSDLLAKKEWHEHEFYLAVGGIRAYIAIPLVVRGKPIGVAVFSRMEPMPFTDEQTSILVDVSRSLAVAVANAIANEEIRKLRDQLEAENIALRSQLGQAPWFEGIVCESAAIRRVLQAVEQVASTDATVLITGETGVGKELIARAIHRRSERAHGPLVQVNCSAIPGGLLASELFGHERGAFTGAVERRKGRFEQAHGGTLFLDEIGEMPLETQVVLLRVLQEREFQRLGGSQTVRVDVRMVGATNRDLAAEVAAGRFRNDLYYRLNVFPIHVPALRDRAEDIPVLAAHFAAKHAARFGRSIERIERRTLRFLVSNPWPGNVRELENFIERAVILSSKGTLRLGADDLRAVSGDAAGMRGQLAGEERSLIESALRASRGRISGPNGAARRLGIPASTLEFRLRRLGIDKLHFRRELPV
jgi:formate hydrogenlyase transcriptional activator